MISQGEGCREDIGGGGWQHTRQTLEKSPTSKLYTTWAHILSDRNVFAPQGGRETAGSNAPGAFLVILRNAYRQPSNNQSEPLDCIFKIDCLVAVDKYMYI